jgi:membrane protein
VTRHARLIAKYQKTRARLERTTLGHGWRRARELDIFNQTLILAALAFVTMIPMFVTLTAISPIGHDRSFSSLIISRLGVSSDAATYIRALFAGPRRVRGATTVFSALILIVNAVSFPIALQRGYELVWRLPPLGSRGLWRSIVWLIGLPAYCGLLVYALPLGRGPAWWTVVSVAAWLLATGLFAWVTQHFLLAGRVGWQALLPAAVATAVGLIGLRGVAAMYLSSSIRDNAAAYGPIGVVFVLLGWTILASGVLLGAAVVGATLHEHPIHVRRRR